MSGEPWPRLLGDHTIQDGERGDEGWQQLWGSVGPLVILQPLWDAPDMQIMQWNWTSARRERRARQEHRETISEKGVSSTIFVLLGCDQCRVGESRCSCVYVYDMRYDKIKLESSCFMEITWGFRSRATEFSAKNTIAWKIFMTPMWFERGRWPYMKILIWQTKGYSNTHCPKQIVKRPYPSCSNVRNHRKIHACLITGPKQFTQMCNVPNHERGQEMYYHIFLLLFTVKINMHHWALGMQQEWNCSFMHSHCKIKCNVLYSY